MGLVTFNYLVNSGKPKRIRLLKKFIAQVFKMEGIQLSVINYIFCSDEYLLKVNREYLGHDYYTDIVTFELNEKREAVVSDIYISTDRVKENAEAFGEDYQAELARVIIHGALHLCGYKDKKRPDIMTMRAKECFYIKKLHAFFSRGTRR